MGFRDLFRRRAEPPLDLWHELHDSPVDWGAGDIARCLSAGCWRFIADEVESAGPRHGWVGKVNKVVVINGIQFLNLVGFEGIGVYAAEFFEKVEPRATAEERFDFRKLIAPAPRVKELA